MLDFVELGELAMVIGRAVALEFLFRLFAEIASIDQKEHAPRATEFDQPID